MSKSRKFFCVENYNERIVYNFVSADSTEAQLLNMNTVSVNDISMGTERLKISVMSKASAISPQIVGRTLGPNCMETPLSAIEIQKSSRVVESKSPKLLESIKLKQSISDSCSVLTTEERKYNNPTTFIGKLIYDLEQERQAEVHQAMVSRLHTLQDKTRKRQAEDKRREDLQSRDRESRALLESQQIQCQLLEQQLRESQRLEKLAVEKRRRENERNQLIRQAEQRAEEDKKHKEEKDLQIQKIALFVQEFQDKHHKLCDIVNTCQDQQAIQSSTLTSLQMVRSLEEAINQLVSQCSVGQVSSLDIQTGAAILLQLDNCSKVIQEDMNNIKIKTEERQTKEKIARELEAQNTAPPPQTQITPIDGTVPVAAIPQQVSISEEPRAIVNTASSLGCLENCVDQESLQTYVKLKKFLEDFQASLLSLTQDPKCKDFLFKCKKAVNTPVNAISDISGAHLFDKLRKLTLVLLGESVDIDNTGFRTSSHPQGIAFCMDLLAMKLVSQGKTTVSSKPEAAFPLAAVIVELWIEFPVFGQLLLAHFYKACPYLVPLYPPQVEGQSDMDYYKSLGYHYDESGQVEKHDQFLKKMSGIMRLFAAILVTKVRQRQKSSSSLWSA